MLLKRSSTELLSAAFKAIACVSLLWILPRASLAADPAGLERVAKWARYETVFRSSVSYDAPLDVTVRAQLISPIGETNTVECFWDGGRLWRLRFRPDLAGTWRFRTLCSDVSNLGLHRREGSFLCTAAVSEERFTRHGPIRRTPRGRTFQHRDATPFLWLADTADGAIRRATAEDWAFYNRIRARQQFTVVQWTLNNDPDANSERMTSDRAGRIPNPKFFRRLDRMIEASNRAGVLNAIDTTSHVLPDGRAFAALRRYAFARWNAYDVAWIVDSIEPPLNADPATTVPILLRVSEAPGALPPWISGVVLNTDSPVLLSSNFHQLKLPVVLTLASRENAVRAGARQRVQADDLRREFWWHALRHCAAGLVYGAAGVVEWNETVENNEDVAVWHKSLFLPGAKQLGVFSGFFTSLPRERLRPARLDLPSPVKVAALQTQNRETGVFFTSQGGLVELPLRVLPDLPVLHWFNPRTGRSHRAVGAVGPTTVRFSTPTPDDWVLLINAQIRNAPSGGEHGTARQRNPGFAW